MSVTSSNLSISQKLSPIALVIGACFLTSPVYANDETEIVEVIGYKPQDKVLLGSPEALLEQQGVRFSAAGGMSSLPVLNGMMGDRVKVLVDGADVTAACANHMNPPLSYISANQIKTISVIAGISPVSSAGDNIAGVIEVNTINPQYNDSENIGWQSGYASAEYRSVNDAMLIGLGMHLSSDSISLDYQGAYEDASSYDDGNGDQVRDTLYRAQNHALTAAFKDQYQQLAVKLTHQYIPFQGFANQYMDMTHNQSYGLTTQYLRELQNGDFQAQFNWHQVEHRMGFFTPEKTGMMPMNTESDDYSAKLRWRVPTSDNQTWLAGAEWFAYRIEDWWPAVADSAMMGPNDYHNIHDGERDRLAIYAESISQLANQWTISAGVRVEHVTTDTGEVQSYSTMSMMGMPNADYAASLTFNAADRDRSDTLVDISLLASIPLNSQQTLELGIARKNRAPNLYERYSWGRGSMAMIMIGWFGDGNGYVGDINLAPETAVTFSAGYQYASADESWQFSINPYYTKISDYIDAQVIGSFSAFGQTDNPDATRNLLQFGNTEATLYGVDIQARKQIADDATWGQWNLQTEFSSVRGSRDDSGEDLYQINPIEAKLSLQHKLANWQNSVSVQWVDSKERVDARRLENTTDNYTLVDIASQYHWQHITLSVSVNNLLNEYYELPLGGVSVADIRMGESTDFAQLPGKGRSINLGLRASF
ncbi:TonB-dependent receptor plug domain-containing protein [Aliiglaciecola aliphaticivorans]